LARTVIRFTTLVISAYAKGGQRQKAEAAFNQTQAAEVTPDIYTYSSLISAYDKGEQ
jgi:pentatricopeptide repeat protein